MIFIQFLILVVSSKLQIKDDRQGKPIFKGIVLATRTNHFNDNRFIVSRFSESYYHNLI